MNKMLSLGKIGFSGVVLFTLVACVSAEVAPPTVAPATATVPVEKVLRITNGEWPPYLSETLPHYGLASRIVTEAFARKGVKVEYGFFPWARALNIAEAGDEWDGAAVWLRNPEREQKFYYSEPVLDSGYTFFHLKSFDFQWATIDDLRGLRIGATLDYDYGAPFTEAEQAGIIAVERVASDEQNLEKLIKGRIDIFPVTPEVGFSMLQKNFSAEEVALVTYHPTYLRSDPLYLLLSRQNPENEALIALFNAGLQELKDSGEFERYFEELRRGE